ncbi:MAG: hypothetical protein AABX96_01060 [Nanoarchaeota archaeon]
MSQAKKEDFTPSGNWTLGELETKLIEFFKKNGQDATIGIHSRRQQFSMDGVRWGMNKGYLEFSDKFDEDDSLGPGAGQSVEYNYKLTEKGRKYFLQR